MMYEKRIYVSYNGNDLSDGFSEKTPVKTLGKAMELSAQGNAEVLLKGDGVYPGNLEYANTANLLIGSYGAGIPIIKSGEGNAITLRECSNIIICGLSTLGEGYDVLNGTTGILACNCEDILISNAETSKYHKAGITLSGCRNSEIAGCFAHDNGAVGINTGRYENLYCSQIRIAHCKVYDNAGDFTVRRNHSGSGIIIAYTEHCTVEFCEAAGNGWAQRQTYVNGPVGIWCCCGCDDITFRYNISRHNRTQPGAVDGDGLDIDGEVKNSVMEYNYTYGNEGSGYLLCEFYGDATVTLWENNVTRYCLSINDDTRVPGYGALCTSTPVDIPFSKMYVNDNLFVASQGCHCIYNKSIPATVSDLNITDNLLVTDGTPTIHVPDHKYMKIAGNLDIPNEYIRTDILKHAPLLKNPRELQKQPVFKYLEDKSCYDRLMTEGAASLFTNRPVPEKAQGFRLVELQLYGPDTEGCDKAGQVSLYYDSIKPGVVTRLKGSGSEISIPLPWWEKEKRYIVRASARLQSPMAKACLFIRDENGCEKKAYFAGSVAQYHFVELEFAAEDKWFDPGKYVGVRLEDDHFNVYVYSIEFIELLKNDSYKPDPLKMSGLTDFVSHGDCYYDEGCIHLSPGSCIEKSIPSQTESCRIQVELEASEATGLVYMEQAGEMTSSRIEKGDHTLEIQIPMNSDTITLGIKQDSFSKGRLKIKRISFFR